LEQVLRIESNIRLLKRQILICLLGMIILVFLFCGRDSFLPMRNETLPEQIVNMGQAPETWTGHELAAGQKHIYTWRYEAGPYEKIEIKTGSSLSANVLIFPDGSHDSVKIFKKCNSYDNYSGYFSIGSDTSGSIRLEISGYGNAGIFENQYLIRKYHQDARINLKGGEYRDTILPPTRPVYYRNADFEDSLSDTLTFLYPDSRYAYSIILKPFELFNLSVSGESSSRLNTHITSHDSIIRDNSYWNEYGDTINVTISLNRNSIFSKYGVWDDSILVIMILLAKHQMPVVLPDRFSKDTGAIVLDIDTSYVLSQIREEYDEYIYVVTPGNIYNLKIEWDSSQYMNAYVSVDGMFKYSDWSMDTSVFVLLPAVSDTIFVRIDKDDYYLSAQYTMELSNYTGPLSQDNYEPDGAITKAVLLTHDSVQTHSIFPAAESDFFKFGLLAQDTFSISINSDDAAALAWMKADFGGTIDFSIKSDITFIDSNRTAGSYRMTCVKRFTDTVYMELTAPNYVPYTVLLRKY
jgi:hypothetical protein